MDLEHGVASLYPLQPGRVAEVLVAENQEVTQGAELLRLEDGIARSRLAEAEAAVELAQLQLRQARKQPELHRSRIAQQQAMRDAMDSRVAAARRVLAREEKLAKSAIITESDRSISEEKIRELEALERAEAERLAELEAQDVEVEVRRAEYELKAAEARREQARLALEECRVRAPRPGTVLRILVGPGDVLGGQPGQPAVLFAADGPQVIRATVEQEFAEPRQGRGARPGPGRRRSHRHLARPGRARGRVVQSAPHGLARPLPVERRAHPRVRDRPGARAAAPPPRSERPYLHRAGASLTLRAHADRFSNEFSPVSDWAYLDCSFGSGMGASRNAAIVGSTFSGLSQSARWSAFGNTAS